ncbi:asparaginyl-tRNA synthetase [Lentinula aciculospora]|uniref:Asparaginyl-tRNA synthetase n=1 Tax=Lentinula aciculospora TaxID=153920 RepID=A0A9W9DJR1_9AGAR|nr:asparaginyl-tRNA synthetase [Lentinula aciculospora]
MVSVAVRRLPSTIKQLLEQGSTTFSVTTITGHVRSIRRQKRSTFALIDDGSTARGLQAVFKHGFRREEMNAARVDKLKQLTFGTAVSLTGKLVESTGPGQDVELLVEATEEDSSVQRIQILGKCDPNTYPLQSHHFTPSSSTSGAHSVEYLRDHLHLRLRTPAMQHTMRLRAKVKEALEAYLSGEQEFMYVHTPVITSIDAEGGGESFRIGRIPKTDRGGDDEGEEEEFFGRPAHLTVSSQLHLEAFQAALGRVYTLAPCFRAERSMTGRHLAEFWMLEYMLRYTLTRVLPKLPESTESRKDGNSFNELRRAAIDEKPWPRITYTQAIRILQQAEVEQNSSQRLFIYPPTIGHSLQSEHEKYLAEVVFMGPVFVLDYPKGVKPFYMRSNVDKVDHVQLLETVACFDLLVPRVGELVGGSVREERYEELKRNMVEVGLIPPSSSTTALDFSSAAAIDPTTSPVISPSTKSENPYEWYLDLRRHGSVPHGGFGMGFERLVLWLDGAGGEGGKSAGMGNIRETVGMPRWKGRMGIISHLMSILPSQESTGGSVYAVTVEAFKMACFKVPKSPSYRLRKSLCELRRISIRFVFEA